MLSPSHKVIVVSPSSLGTALPAFAAMQRAMIALRPGDLYERDELVQQLVRHGYQRKQFVDEEGDIAVRGEIVDVFPFARQQPVRVDFRDIEIESIRSFDILTQRSIRPLEEVVITLSAIARGESDGNAGTGEEHAFDSTVFDYMPKDSVLFLDEPDLILGGIEDAALRGKIAAQWGGFRCVTHTYSVPRANDGND